MGMIFSKIAAMFIIMLVGFVIKKKRIINSEDSIPVLSSLLLNVTTPCMIFCSLYKRSVSLEMLVWTLEVLLGAFLYFALATIFAFIITKAFKFTPKEDIGVYVTSIAAINSGFIGFPVAKTIFGDNVLYLMVIHNIVLGLYLYGAVPAILNAGDTNKKMSFSKIFKTIATNPAIIAMEFGVAMMLTGIQPPMIVDEILQPISDITIPLSMIVVGMQLANSKLNEIIKNRNIWIATIIAMVIIPAAAFLIVAYLDFLPIDVRITLILATVFPTAVITAVITEQENKNGVLSAEIVSLTTLVSVVTIPIAAALLLNLA